MSEVQFVPKSKEQRKAEYLADRQIRDSALNNRIPFITPDFLPDFFLYQGLVVVGAKTGKGKSTLCANVVAGYLNSNPEATAMIISNEEATDAVYDRIACNMLQLDYQSYFLGKLEALNRQAVEDLSFQLMDRVEVVGGKSFPTNIYENVKAVLAKAAEMKVGMLLIDYFQTINQSSENPEQASYVVLKRLGNRLRSYGKEHAIPVVTFVQLRDDGGKDFADRVQNDKTIANDAFIAIETTSDFDAAETTFIIHKDRFLGKTGKKVIMKYVGGRYVMPNAQPKREVSNDY